MWWFVGGWVLSLVLYAIHMFFHADKQIELYRSLYCIPSVYYVHRWSNI